MAGKESAYGNIRQKEIMKRKSIYSGNLRQGESRNAASSTVHSNLSGGE